MNTDSIHVLLVEDNQDYANILQIILEREDQIDIEVTIARQLNHACTLVSQYQFDAILLDLSLPDSEGFDTFIDMHTYAPDLPIVVITGLDDEAVAMRSVREGAQDYLIKGGIEGPLLVRAVRYAIERHHTITRLQNLSLIDELTGLLNRRGFMKIARQHIKIARRGERKLLLFFADLDELKKINDNFGHQEGDRALKTIAAVLKASFRSSDVIGRLGGDEFTVLAVDAKSGGEGMIERIQEAIQQCNEQNSLYPISLSVGVVAYDVLLDSGLEDLLARADAALYQQKSEKRISNDDR